MDQRARTTSTPPPGPSAGLTAGDSLAARPGRLAGAGPVTAAMTAANLLGYALNLFASRRLGPSQFGLVAALLGVVVIANVAALAVQAVIARRVSLGAPSRWTLGVATRTALVAGVICLGAVPVLVVLLHLRSPIAAVWTAAVVTPLILISAQLGVLQGREQFRRLAVGYLIGGAGKVGGGLVGLAVHPTPAGVMAGTAIGALLGWVAALPLVAHDPSGTADDSNEGPAGTEILHAGQALLALFLLTNVDLLAARHYFSAHDAGLYAVGAVLAKGAFWLPSAVPVLLLPRLVDRHRRWAGLRAGLVVLFACGTATTVVCAVAGHLVVRFVGGSAYSALSGYAWAFALEGSLFAVAQLFLYSHLARANRWASLLLWGVLVAYVTALVVVRPTSPLTLVVVAVSAAACLVVAGSIAPLTNAARKSGKAE